MLDECRTVDEAKDIIDKAAAAQIYAKKAKLGMEAQNYAAEIKVWHERKAGELLRELKRGHGPGRGKKVPTVGHVSEYREALESSGATTQDASRWGEMADLPVDDFREHVEERKADGKEITTAGIVKKSKAKKRKAKKVAKAETLAASNEPLPIGERKYQVIYADPPWRYEHMISESREIENQYPTMTLQEIKDLPVGDMCHDDCVLFLWATSPKLESALEVIGSWGFSYRTCAVWDKEVIGMGYYFRQQHELLLVATRGNPGAPMVSARVSSVIKERRGKHSSKPSKMYGLIETMYPGAPRIELFSREPQPGWDAWGNQSDA